MPLINDKQPTYQETILDYIQGDMRKLMFVKDIFNKKPELTSELLTEEKIKHIFCTKSYNEDSKKITQSLINNSAKMEQHNKYMNETDRTIVALLWHENIVDVISDKPVEKSFPFYSRILKNMCYADYIDRITFQSQIWQFNEMSSLIKTFHNNKLYHDSFPENKNIFNNEIRFTKVLTKYSTEYNNYIFIQNLCQLLNMDQKDLFYFFFYIKERFQENEIYNLFENYEISKLDINRIFRFIDKYTNENAKDYNENDLN